MKAFLLGASQDAFGSSDPMPQDHTSQLEVQAKEDAQCYSVFFKTLATSQDLSSDGDLIDRFSKAVRPTSK